MIADSNIIIYSALPEYEAIERYITQNSPAVSAISKVEVLGFSRLTPKDKAGFEAFFASSEILSVSFDIIEQAVALRQQKKMTLGDAIIAATCLLYDLPLVTRNVKDFNWIAGLTVINPFEENNEQA